MTRETLVSVLTSGEIYVAVGLFGSAIEAVAIYSKSPKLEKFGKTLEAIALDAPKIIMNIGKGLVLVANIAAAFRAKRASK